MLTQVIRWLGHLGWLEVSVLLTPPAHQGSALASRAVTKLEVSELKETSPKLW